MRFGIDLGGTKIEAIALDDDGRIVQRRRIPTPHNYDGSLHALAGLVQDFERTLGCRAPIGVGTPGELSPKTGLMKNANSVWLNGRALPHDLNQLLPRPWRFANDANCFALSEAKDGAAAGAANVFGVIVGTGTGGGVVINGNLCTGINAIAGEWGHNPLPWPHEDELPGPKCYCGKNGCIETFLSGPGFATDHEQATGEMLTAAMIALRAARGEGKAEATLLRYEERMARALASIINVLDPDVIVLGGGMSNLQHLYTSVPHFWMDYVFSDRVDTRLLPPKHGDSSGVRGAAWLWEPGEADDQL